MCGKKEEKKVAPENLTPEERAYYRETWGFDPVTDKKDSPPLPRVLYYYETLIPLENDPDLQAAGVTLHAWVEVDEEGVSHNRILFKRGDKSAAVECLHTAVYSAPVREVFNLPKDKLEELAFTTEGRPAHLPPWGHFAALKSFVGGLAANGLLKLCSPSASNSVIFSKISGWGPFDQIQRILLELAPEILFPAWDTKFADILDTVTVQWILERSVFINDEQPTVGKFERLYPLKRVFNNHMFLESLDTAVREKLFYILLELIKRWENDVDTEGRLEDNEIERTYSPRILILTLTARFVQTLDPRTTVQVLWVLEAYQWYCRPENEINAPGKVRAEELEAPINLLVRHGLKLHKLRDLKQIVHAFYLVPNALGLRNPLSVFDDANFTVPELLNDFDAAHLREIIECQGELLVNARGYLLYHCMRLVLEREGASPENNAYLRMLVRNHVEEWKKRYLSALVREFKFIEDFVRTTSRESGEEEGKIRKENPLRKKPVLNDPRIPRMYRWSKNSIK